VVLDLDQLAETTGDIMVFTTGLTKCESIRQRILAAELHGIENTDVIVIAAAVSRQDKEKAIRARGGRKRRRRIVITTNVFTNTFTATGFTLVIDTLQRKIEAFDPVLDRCQMVTVPASLNGANSTAGRICRTQPGIALRAATEADFVANTVKSHPPKVTPEEYTANLLYKLALYRRRTMEGV
jgi:HrpA-like RNA helicase